MYLCLLVLVCFNVFQCGDVYLCLFVLLFWLGVVMCCLCLFKLRACTVCLCGCGCFFCVTIVLFTILRVDVVFVWLCSVLFVCLLVGRRSLFLFH